MHMVLAPVRKKSEVRATEKAVRDARLAERQAAQQQEKELEAEFRKAPSAKPKKKGPADNMDPDIDL